MKNNIVTKSRTRHEGGSIGRPRKHPSNAARQKAHRARKAAAIPLQIGSRVFHKKYGKGIVLRSDKSRAHVAFPKGTRVIWPEVGIDELTVTGLAKTIPTWADWNIHKPKKRLVQMGGFPVEEDKRSSLGHMPGQIWVRKYRQQFQ